MRSRFLYCSLKILSFSLIAFWGDALALAKLPIPADTVGPSTSMNQTKIIMIAPTDKRELFETVNRAVESQLSDLHVTFSIHWVPSLATQLSEQETTAELAAAKTKATIVFWIDLSHPQRTYLYISVPQMKRVVVRRLDDSAPGARLETLAIIVRSSVLSTLRLGKWTTSNALSKNARERPEKKEVHLETDARNKYYNDVYFRPGSRLALRAAWAVDALSSSNPFNNGAIIGIDAGLGRHFHLHADYQLCGPINNSLDDVRIALKRHPISAGIRYNHISGHLEFGARIDAVLDIITADVKLDSAENADLSTGAEDAEVEFAVAPQFHIGVRFVDRIIVFIALGVEMPFTSMEYIVEKDGLDGDSQYQTIFISWPVRPIGRLGLSVGLL